MKAKHARVVAALAGITVSFGFLVLWQLILGQMTTDFGGSLPEQFGSPGLLALLTLGALTLVLAPGHMTRGALEWLLMRFFVRRVESKGGIGGVVA